MTASLSYKVRRLDIDGNATLSQSLVNEIKQVLDDLDDGRRGSIVLMYMHGSPEASSNQGWPGNEREIDVHLVSQWEQSLRRLERLPAITIGAVEGMCGGVALEVLLVTDYRLASKNFSIQIQGPLGGMWPGMAIHRLANQFGVAKARKLILFGGELSASQLHELGLADEVANEVEVRISSFIDSLKENIDAGMAIRRTLLLEAISTPFEDALGSHLAGCDQLIRSMRRSENAS
jgi:isomerase DpgB